ncbi:hypothetical protein V8E53_012181 [Lactarius tabidus]
MQAKVSTSFLMILLVALSCDGMIYFVIPWSSLLISWGRCIEPTWCKPTSLGSTWDELDSSTWQSRVLSCVLFTGGTAES